MNISKNDIIILRDAKEWKMLILKRMLVYMEKEIAQNYTIEITMGGFLLYERPLCVLNFNGRY